MVNTQDSNQAALQLYEGVGFRRVGRRCASARARVCIDRTSGLSNYASYIRAQASTSTAGLLAIGLLAAGC